MNEKSLSMREEYLASLPETIENLEYLLLQLGRGGADSLWAEFLRTVHSIKGGAGSFGVGFVGTVCHDFETYLSETGPDQVDVDLCLRFVDLLSEYTNDYLANSISTDESGYLEKLRQIVPAREAARFKVLVVENTQAMFEYYAKTLLEKYDVTVVYEKTGLGALARLMKEEYDALLTSMYVGDLDGPSLIAALKVTRSPNRGIPTFLITSDVAKAVSSTGFDADFVLQKSRNLHDELLKYYDDIFNKSFFIGLLPRRQRGALQKILCIDDDEMIFGLVKIGLKKLSTPAEIEYVGSGREALARLKKGCPDLILMDVMMPEKSGPETLREIRANPKTADIPVIFLTGQEEKSEINALLDMGPLGVVRKPFDNKKLAAYIEAIWGRKC